MPNVGDVSVRLTANTAQFVKAFETAQKKMSAAASAMIGVGSRLSLALSVPVAFVGVTALRTAGEFQAAMNKVKAISGATGAEFNTLKEQALELGRTTAFTAKDAADAMGFLAMAGNDAASIFASLPDTLLLASSAALDLATSADVVTNIMAGFNLEQDELTTSVDVLVTAFTSANTNLQQLAQALKFAGPVASAAGLSFNETTAALALMGNAGIQATLAGTGLRGAITRLLSPTKEAQRSLDRLGVQATDSSGKMKSLVQIVREFEGAVERAGGSATVAGDFMEIFGNRAGPAMQVLVSQGSVALEALIKKFEQSGGIAERITRIQLEGYIGALRRLQSSYEGLQISLGTALIPLFEKFSDVGVSINQKLIGMDSATRNFILALSAIAITVGPAILALGFLAKFVTPFGILTAVALAFGAAAFTVAANWEEAGPRVIRVLRALQSELQDRIKTSTVEERLAAVFGGTVLASWILGQGKLLNLLSSFKTAVGVILVAIARLFKLGAIAVVFTVLIEAWNRDITTLSTILHSFGIDIDSELQMAVDAFADAKDILMDTLGEIISGDWEALRDRISRTFEVLEDVAMDFLNALDDVLPGTKQWVLELGDAWERQAERMRAAIPTLEELKQEWETFKSRVAQVGDDISNAIDYMSERWTAFRQNVSRVVTALQTSFNQLEVLFNDFKNSDFVTGLADAFSQASVAISGYAKDAAAALQNLQDFISEAVSSVLAFGDDLLFRTLGEDWEQFKSTVNEAIDAIVKKIDEFKQKWKEIKDTIKDSLPDFSGAFQSIEREWTAFVNRISQVKDDVATFFGFGEDSPSARGITETKERIKDLQQEAEKLGDLDVFGRGATFAGERFNPKKQFPIREATEFERTLENITVDLRGIEQLEREIERFNPEKIDIEGKIGVRNKEKIIADWRDMRIAINTVWAQLGETLDSDTARALLRVTRRFQEFESVIVGNSIVPDTAEAIKEVWQEGMASMTDTTGKELDIVTQKMNAFSAMVTGLDLNPFASSVNAMDFSPFTKAIEDLHQNTTQETFNMFKTLRSTILDSSLGDELKASLVDLLGSFEGFFKGAEDFADKVTFENLRQQIQKLGEEGDLFGQRLKDVGQIWREYEEAIAEVTAKTKVLGAAYDPLQDKLAATRQALIDLQIELDRVGGVGNLDPKSKEDFEQKQQKLAEELKKLENQEAIKEAFDGLANTFANSIDTMVRGALQGTQKIGDLFKNMVKNILLSLASRALQNAIFSIFGMIGNAAAGAAGGGSGSSAAAGVLQAIFGNVQARAGGGSALANQPYVVGERGPELFVPNQSGRVVPNRALMAGGGSGPQVEINIINQSNSEIKSRESQDGMRRKVELLVTDVFTRDMAGGGKMSQSITQTFGTPRTGGNR